MKSVCGVIRKTGLAALLSLALTAHAAPSGTIVITDHQVDATAKSFDRDLKKAQKSSLAKAGDGWHVYFVAYLKKAAGSTEVNLVFYDLTDTKNNKEPPAVPIGTQASAKIVQSDTTIGTEQGIVAGHKYEVRLTRLINGKEDVYARAKIELK